MSAEAVTTICMGCQRVTDDPPSANIREWREQTLDDRERKDFSHGWCMECFEIEKTRLRVVCGDKELRRLQARAFPCDRA